MKKHSIDKELAGYLTAAGAVVMGVSSTEATIIHTPADITVGRNANVFLDLDNNGSNDFNFDNSSVSTSSSGENIISRVTAGRIWETNASNDAVRLSLGQSIGPAANWDVAAFLHRTSSGSLTAGEFNAPGYIGVSFDPNGGTDWKYGWIHIDSISPDYKSYHIDSYAFEDSGNPIQAGAIPEPASLVMLALGASGIMGFRRLSRR